MATILDYQKRFMYNIIYKKYFFSFKYIKIYKLMSGAQCVSHSTHGSWVLQSSTEDLQGHFSDYWSHQGGLEGPLLGLHAYLHYLLQSLYPINTALSGCQPAYCRSTSESQSPVVIKPLKESTINTVPEGLSVCFMNPQDKKSQNYNPLT